MSFYLRLIVDLFSCAVVFVIFIITGQPFIVALVYSEVLMLGAVLAESELFKGKKQKDKKILVFGAVVIFFFIVCLIFFDLKKLSFSDGGLDAIILTFWFYGGVNIPLQDKK